MKSGVFYSLFLSISVAGAVAADGAVLWLEAESFKDAGGWSNDSQFVDLMGSPYLLATGIGKPVADAVTSVKVPAAGKYRLWVRCKDWFPSHSPGQFQVVVKGKPSATAFGKAQDDSWRWTDGGEFDLEAGEVEVRLHDATGWWGRCDAVVLVDGDFKPATDIKDLDEQRVKYAGVSPEIKDKGRYDVVVVGGGSAGCAAAVSAARHGSKVAFVQDRPVLGGNGSEEIRVPVCGDTSGGKYEPADTGIVEEFYPVHAMTGNSKELEVIVRAEKKIDLFLNTRATGVQMKDKANIASVVALNVRTGERMRFSAPLFIDCTGHGWVGFYAGAEYKQGEDSRDDYGEVTAPLKATTRTMGNSLNGNVIRSVDTPVEFRAPDWAYKWTKPEDFEPLDSHKRQKVDRPPNFDLQSRGNGRQPKPNDPNGAVSGAWWVEYGGVVDTIKDAEKIRDELFRINVGLWDYAKNYNPKTKEANANRELAWINYVPGTRESRRLIGDYVMTEKEYTDLTVHEDTVAYTGWGADIHHPEGFWVKGNDCIHYYRDKKASIPFRTLYSKNIDNLMMAGRCHSATHIAMGGTRIARTCCEMGHATGVAAAMIKKYDKMPRSLCKDHVNELQQILLKEGAYLIGVPNRDSADLAMKAKASASSSFRDEKKGIVLGPENVNNGWNRAISGVRNAWVLDPKEKLPQWVQIDLPSPETINCVHVSFQNRKILAADFDVQVDVSGEWKTVAEGAGNSDRRRVLRFDPVKTGKVRLVLKRALGEVGVCEIRIYNEAN